MDGVTGILCADEEEMARAIPRAMALDPAACRAHAAAHFDRDLIARQHLALYERVLGVPIAAFPTDADQLQQRTDRRISPQPGGRVRRTVPAPNTRPVARAMCCPT